ncbi:type II secretion system F family protein [Arthrobacter sp. TMN-37]
MTGLLVGLMLALAVLVLQSTPPLPPGIPARPALSAAGTRAADRRNFMGFFRREPAGQAHEPALLVHQVTGLLRAGRSPLLLWNDLEALYADAADGGSVFAVRSLPVLRAAGRSASLGLGVPEVLRAAGNTAGTTVRVRVGPRSAPGNPAPTLWTDLAACFSVAERSGAPLAEVLTRYAGQLEAAVDAQAARETALAGPRATVTLLGWLPVVGVLLGYLMGVNPLGVLFGSSLGVLVLLLGLGLMLAGRVWSSRLVAAAVRGP